METLFEKIIKREIPSKIVYEDEDVLAFLDISQATQGHTLVVPKRVTENVLTADKETIAKVNIVAQKLAIELVDIFKAQGVNILSNANAVAGQTVFHYHVHVIPRYSEAELRFVPQEDRIVDLDGTYEAILNSRK